MMTTKSKKFHLINNINNNHRPTIATGWCVVNIPGTYFLHWNKLLRQQQPQNPSVVTWLGQCYATNDIHTSTSSEQRKGHYDYVFVDKYLNTFVGVLTLIACPTHRMTFNLAFLCRLRWPRGCWNIRRTFFKNFIWAQFDKSFVIT